MVEVKIIEKNKHLIEFEVVGEDHTIMNLLKEELYKDEDVVVATYKIEHPLLSNPVMLVETKSKDAVEAIKEAIERIKKKNKEVEKEVNRVAKQL